MNILGIGSVFRIPVGWCRVFNGGQWPIAVFLLIKTGKLFFKLNYNLFPVYFLEIYLYSYLLVTVNIVIAIRASCEKI